MNMNNLFNIDEQAKDNNINNNLSFSILNDLDDFMENELKDEISDIDESTKIDDFKANLFLKSYLKLEEEKSSVDEVCNKELERVKNSIEGYRKQMHKEIENKQKFLKLVLKKFLDEKLEEKKGKSKTIKLPYGSLSIRKNAPKFEYQNEDQILEFLKNNAQDLVLTKNVTSIDKKNLKAKAEISGSNILINGMIVPYVKVEEQEDKFEIKKNKQ